MQTFRYVYMGCVRKHELHAQKEVSSAYVMGGGGGGLKEGRRTQENSETENLTG